MLSVIIIISVLPKSASFPYDFRVGQRWDYPSLAAPFSFPIIKANGQLSEEKNTIRKSHLPYFSRDTVNDLNLFTRINTVLSELLQIKKINNVQYRQLLVASQAAGAQLIKQGVIESIPATSAFKSSPFIFVVRPDGRTEANTYAMHYTVQQARQIMKTYLMQVPGADAYIIEKIASVISPDISYNRSLTEKTLNDVLKNVSEVAGAVNKGEMIIERGEIIDQNSYSILSSLQKEYETNKIKGRSWWLVTLGQSILTISSMIIFLMFLFLMRREVYRDNMKVLLLLAVSTGIICIYSWTLKNRPEMHYLVPFCILPIIVRAFFDTRLALFSLLCTLLIAGITAPNGLEFFFMHTVAGISILFSIVNLRSRSQLFIASGNVLLSYMVVGAGFSFIYEGHFLSNDIEKVAWLSGNAILTLSAYPIIYVIEKIFGLISDVKMVELSDVNTVLLKELAIRAPGTFQHSLHVANLAEAAVDEIGGNPLLVRTGALYHDIGKIENPSYFIENQVSGFNPHDQLPFEESAKIIIAHVSKGVDLGHKYDLPETIVDFIRTHHGDSLVKFFYNSYIKAFPNGDLPESTFRYKGPKPYSKETAVLMMADSIEAASHSLSQHDPESINKMVDDIIEHQIETKQFIGSNITFADIEKAKRIFKKMLVSMYHGRIKYDV